MRLCTQGLLGQLAKEPLGAHDPEVAPAWEELCAVRRIQWEKTIKAKLEAAIEQFNEDYKKGFQVMQVRAFAQCLNRCSLYASRFCWAWGACRHWL